MKDEKTKVNKAAEEDKTKLADEQLLQVTGGKEALNEPSIKVSGGGMAITAYLAVDHPEK